MSLPDATASAAMGASVLKPVWFLYLDVVSDPVRANSSGEDLTITGSGLVDLNGTYIGVDSRVLSVSPVRMKPGGSETVTVKLSGIRGLDDDDRALLANPANWQSRVARLWRMIRDEANVQQGAIQHYHTGFMMGLAHVGNAVELTLDLSIESYLAAFNAASGRSYADQEAFDEQDLSPRAAFSMANGNTSSTVISGAGGSGETPASDKAKKKKKSKL